MSAFDAVVFDSGVFDTGSGGATWVSPADAAGVGSTPVLVFNTVVSAVPMHCHMQIDTVNTFNSGNLRDLKTTLSQTGWEYWNNTAWTAIPSTGIPAAFTGNEARYTVQSALATGVWYRRVRVG